MSVTARCHPGPEYSEALIRGAGLKASVAPRHGIIHSARARPLPLTRCAPAPKLHRAKICTHEVCRAFPCQRSPYAG
jgi:hypothetical protein